MFLKKIVFLYNFLKIDNITLDPDPDVDPDPNWAKILDPDPNQWIHNTASEHDLGQVSSTLIQEDVLLLDSGRSLKCPHALLLTQP